MECLCDAQIRQHHKTALLIDRGKDNNIPKTTRCEVSEGRALDTGDFAEPIDKAQLNRDEC